MFILVVTLKKDALSKVAAGEVFVNPITFISDHDKFLTYLVHRFLNRVFLPICFIALTFCRFLFMNTTRLRGVGSESRLFQP